MSADYPSAIWMPVPSANVFPNYWGNKPKWLVLHKTASGGTPQDIANFFIHDPNQASSHYIVGQDGTIVQCVSESDGAGANGILETGHASYLPTDVNLNCLTLSVEHVDPASDNSTPLTSAQKAASFQLAHDICQRHNIPMRAGDANGGIIGHHDIAPIDRARCPGNYPMDELFLYLQGGSVQQYSTNSSDFGAWFTAPDDDHWQAKQGGHVVQLGIKGFYATLSLDGNSLPLIGLPVTNEIYTTVNGAKIVLQVFERGGIWYDPNHLKGHQPGTGDCSLCALNDSDFLAHVPGLPTTAPAPVTPVDTTQAIADVNAIADGVAALVAKALVTIKKL